MDISLQIILGLSVSGIIWYLVWLGNKPPKPPTEAEKLAHREYLDKNDYPQRKYWYEK